MPPLPPAQLRLRMTLCDPESMAGRLRAGTAALDKSLGVADGVGDEISDPWWLAAGRDAPMTPL